MLPAAGVNQGRDCMDSVRIGIIGLHNHYHAYPMANLLRYIPAYQKAKELVEQGVVGKLTSAFYSIRIPATFIKDAPDVDYQGWYTDPIKGGGGGFIDHGVHFTDWLRWFFECDAV